MPDSVGTLSNAEHNGVVRLIILGTVIFWTIVFWTIVGYGHGLMLIGAEPGLATVEATANVAAIIVEDDVFAVNAAGELSPGDFHLCGFVAWDASVSDGYAPQ
jgi:hypothetical protein